MKYNRNIAARKDVTDQLTTNKEKQLSGEPFDVLLTHESARDAVWEGSGSEEIGALLSLARPAFHFFGHYSGKGRRIEGDFGATQVYLLAGMELGERGGGLRRTTNRVCRKKPSDSLMACHQ